MNNLTTVRAKINVLQLYHALTRDYGLEHTAHSHTQLATRRGRLHRFKEERYSLCQTSTPLGVQSARVCRWSSSESAAPLPSPVRLARPPTRHPPPSTRRGVGLAPLHVRAAVAARGHCNLNARVPKVCVLYAVRTPLDTLEHSRPSTPSPPTSGCKWAYTSIAPIPS